MGVIYKLTCKTSTKCYIGQTKHTSKYRWNQHKWEANNPQCKQSRLLNRSIVKYGHLDFVIEDLIECSGDELDKWEIHYIELYDTFGNGLNLTKGGKKNQIVSEETRERLGIALKGKPKNVKDNRKRCEDNNLPKYLKHYKDQKCEGYKVSDHPNLKKHNPNASISFTKSTLSMEEKLNNALDVLDQLDKDIYVYQSKKEPKGVQPIPNGYRVRIKGHPVKTFQNKKYTMEEKLNMAIEYTKTIL